VLKAGDDTSLEYYPSLTIPFPGSALKQTVTVTAAPTARVLRGHFAMKDGKPSPLRPRD